MRDQTYPTKQEPRQKQHVSLVRHFEPNASFAPLSSNKPRNIKNGS